MNVESFRNILSNLLNLYVPSYECSKVLNYRNIYQNKPKRVLSISIRKNFSNLETLCQFNWKNYFSSLMIYKIMAQITLKTS